MIADRNDIQNLVAQKHRDRQSELMPMYRMLAGAAQPMAELLVDERWTRYQGLLQGLVGDWTKKRDAAKERLGSGVLQDDELRKLNADVLQANVAIDAWMLALQLPSAIVRGGEAANLAITEFDKKNAAAGQA